MNNMYGALTFIGNNYEYFNGQILEKLTPLQKKVGAIVLAVLAGLTAVYALYCYWKTSKAASKVVLALPVDQEHPKEAVKKIERVIQTKNDNKIKQEAKKPEAEIAQQIQEVKPVERDSVPEELKKEVQELLETINTCLEKMTTSNNGEFKAEHEWNHSLYEFIMTLCRFTNIEVYFNLKESLQLLKEEEEHIELKLKPKIPQLVIDPRKKLKEIVNEFELAVGQVNDCCHKLEPKHAEKLSSLQDTSVEKKIAFIKEFQSVCGNKGQRIKETCEIWFQQVSKMNQKKEKIHNDYSTLLNGVTKNKVIEFLMKAYGIKEKNFLKVQQTLNGRMQVLQEVYGKIDRIMEIGEHLLEFFESLDNQKALVAPL